MASKANIRQVGDVLIVDLSGRIALGDGSGVVRDTVKDMLKEGQKNILLNLGDVTYIDSAGLGMLVAAYLSAKTNGASLCLCHLGPKFQEVLQITKLATVFPVYGTEAAAVASFSNRPK